MHRGFRLIALLAASLVALAGIAAGSAEARLAPQRTIFVRALASGGWTVLPVRGARVRVLHGGEVIARGRVGSLGAGILRTRRATPPSFRITVSGGRIGEHRFRGQISATVRGYRYPQIAHVDFATTLADRYRRAHPGLSARKANHRTKRFLRLPSSYAIGPSGTADVGFDGRRFLAAAGRNGGYGRYVSGLVRRMASPRAHRRFRSGSNELVKVASQIIEGKGIFKLIESSTSLGGFAKTVLGLAGGEKQSKLAEELHQIDVQLQQIEQTLAVVKQAVTELRAEARAEDFNVRVAAALGTLTGVPGATKMLHHLTEMAIEENCSTATPGPQCGEIAKSMTGPAGFTKEVDKAELASAGQVKKLALEVAGDALPKSPTAYEGLIQGASAVATPADEAFFTAAQSRWIRSEAVFWITTYTEAAATGTSAWALGGADPLTLEEDTRAVAEFATGMPRTLPEELSAATTLDIANGRLWPTGVSAQNSEIAYPETLREQLWSYDGSAGRWESNTGETLWPIGKGGALPYDDWRIAGAAQVESTLHAVTPASSNQTPGEAVLEQSGIELGTIAPPWGSRGQRGLELEYVKAWHGEEGCEGSRWSCYWPITLAIGNQGAAGLEVVDFNGAHPVWEYWQRTFKVQDPLNLEWYGRELWGYAHEGIIFGNESMYSMPLLMYRPVQAGQCFYYPTTGDPATGSPGCPKYPASQSS